MKSESGFSFVEVVITLMFISGSVLIVMSNIIICRTQLIKTISEKALLIEYHNIMEIFYQDYDKFEKIIDLYYEYKDNSVIVKPYNINKEYLIYLNYQVVDYNNYIKYSLEVSFPDLIKNNNITYFDDKIAEIIVYE